MRISTRHLVSARLLMLLAAALLLLPGTAFARGVQKPSRSHAKPTRRDGEAEAGQEGCAPHPARGHQAGAEARHEEARQEDRQADRLGRTRLGDAAGAGRRAARRWRPAPTSATPAAPESPRRAAVGGAHGRPDARAGRAGRTAAGLYGRGSDPRHRLRLRCTGRTRLRAGDRCHQPVPDQRVRRVDQGVLARPARPRRPVSPASSSTRRSRRPTRSPPRSMRRRSSPSTR